MRAKFTILLRNREKNTHEASPRRLASSLIKVSIWLDQPPGIRDSATTLCPSQWTSSYRNPGKAVSQGKGTIFNDRNSPVTIRWESPEPQDEIFLIGGRFTEYSNRVGTVDVMAFLRTPDERLANTYLTTTTQYLEMYSALLGPYLYSKFALVENFWETGYGMPSFTLLGPKVLRFPFIRHSSYPHEILHNWWGQGVYVDSQSGNWSEGLTTYLADHLIKEQRGTAADYRRSTLQQYADYVAEANDFPLTDFRSRHSAVTQAVGYGKTLMLFHMLRQQLGDEIFIEGLRTFYRNNTFRRATYNDLRQAFEQTSKQDLSAEFAQWVTRAGAPAIRISNARAETEGEGVDIPTRCHHRTNPTKQGVQAEHTDRDKWCRSESDPPDNRVDEFAPLHT